MGLLNRIFERFSKRLPSNGSSVLHTSPVQNTDAPKTLDQKLVYSLHGKKIPSAKQLKYLPQMLDPHQRLIIIGALGIALVSAIALLIIFFNRNFDRVPADGGDYTGGLIGAPQYINPLLAQNDVDIDLSRLIFSGLMKYNKDLKVVPDLAERYEVSEDHKVYTFVLRENARWHDGEPVTAEDIIFTFESIQNTDFRSPLIISFRGVAIEKIDERTVRFTLSQPYPSFLEVLTAGILPEHLWREISPINANLTEYNIKPVGSGPWMFETLSKDRLGNIKTYNLKPNFAYYDQKPHLQHLTFKFYPDFVSAVEALKNHSVEGISFLPKELKPQLASQKSLYTYSFYLPQYTAIFFNQKKLDALRDKNVRQALALGIDKQRILADALELEGEIIQSPLLPVAITLQDDKVLNFRPNQANKLLDDAGWKRISQDEYKAFKFSQLTSSSSPTSTEPIAENIDGDTEELQEFYRKDGDIILEITLTTVNHPVNVKTAEIIKHQWENIGVKVNISVIDSSRITREAIKPRNYEVLLFGIIVGSNADPFPFWHSSQVADPGLNLAQFSHRDADKQLEGARATNVTDDKKTEHYTSFVEILAQDVPAVFLYNPTYAYVVDKKIKGVDIDRINIPADRFNNINEWYSKQHWRWKGSLR